MTPRHEKQYSYYPTKPSTSSPRISTEPMRVTVIGHVTPNRTPQRVERQPASSQEYAYPSPPRSDYTNPPPTAESLPCLPAFPPLQGAPVAPEPQKTQPVGHPQPTPEQLTPTIYFQIQEQSKEKPSNGAPPGAEPTSPPQDGTAAADTSANQGTAAAAIPISDDEGGREPQDAEMEPVEQPPHHDNSNANKHTTTIKEVHELQRRLKPHTEQTTQGPADNQPEHGQQHHKEQETKTRNGDPPRSADPIETSTPDHQNGAPGTGEGKGCQQPRSTPDQNKTQQYPATPQHLQTLYTGMCQKLHIPEQAHNKRMQQTAAEAYNNIQQHADHALAVIRMLTLAKWNPKHDIEPPLQQLLHQVATGGPLTPTKATRHMRK